MKKIAIATAFVMATTMSSAANYVSLEIDGVKDTSNRATSTAQYFRAGTNAAGFNLDLAVRTAVYRKGGMLNSVEGTVGKSMGPINVFGGVGYDNGFNGAKGTNYQYGLLGASAGVPVGPVYAFGGVKTRVNWDSANPKQTVAFAGVSYPLTKTLSVDLDVSRSYQDIKEKAAGVGVRVNF
jgi:hypothetical protein